MANSAFKLTLNIMLAVVLIGSASQATPSMADIIKKHHHRRSHSTRLQESIPAQASETEAVPAPGKQGVSGYFGPAPYASPYYGYGTPRPDVGYGLLGALNGGGLRGYVECSNYYSRSPGACGF